MPPAAECQNPSISFLPLATCHLPKDSGRHFISSESIVIDPNKRKEKVKKPFAFSLFLYFENMETPEATRTTSGDGGDDKKSVYSVCGFPPENVRLRIKKLMDGLRSEFDGSQFEPHVTVVGATSLTERDALEKFQSAYGMVNAYTATVYRVSTGTFFYQCVYLLLPPTTEVVEAIKLVDNVLIIFTCMPHLSLFYGDLTDDEKRKAQEKANILDEGINDLSFPITRLALWKTDPEDKTLLSWEKVAECDLSPN